LEGCVHVKADPRGWDRPGEARAPTVGALSPGEVVFDCELLNARDAIQSLDWRLVELATTHTAELVYGLKDHRRYGRLLCQVLTERG
jgi:hypothetical protein